MHLLDTQAWIWFVARDPRAADVAALPAKATLAISGISLWEAAMLDAKGRVRLLPNREAWFEGAVGGLGLLVLPITVSVAARSVAWPEKFPGDPADRIIAATAVEANAELITADRRIIDCAPQIGLRVRPLSSRGKS